MADSALDKLKRMTAWLSTPTLSGDELQGLLDDYAVIDSEGIDPTDEDWIPTYNLRAAARQGWVLKMGKAADLISTDLDGDRMSADQIFEHCERMVRKYSGTASPVIGTTVSESDGSYYDDFFAE